MESFPEPAPGWEIVSGGSTARVERQHGSSQVVKVQYPDCPDPDLTRRELEREFNIYQVLPQHPRLLELHSTSTPERLVLPYLPNGNLQVRLDDHTAPPLSEKQRIQLAADATEAIAVLHQNSVVHGDIQPRNFMLTSEHRLCVIDFAGSAFCGEKGTAVESIRYFLPRPIEELPTVRTDLFALGSVLYAIFSGRAPYEGETDEEVERLYAGGCFPSTKEFSCGDVILGCWKGYYASAQKVLEDIATFTRCERCYR